MNEIAHMPWKKKCPS